MTTPTPTTVCPTFIEKTLSSLFAVLSLKIIIFGGFVRDTIRGDVPNDIDIHVALFERDDDNDDDDENEKKKKIETALDKLAKLLEILGIKKTVTEERATLNPHQRIEAAACYTHYKWNLTIKGQSFTVDVSTDAKSQDNTAWCDFTANNLEWEKWNLSTRCGNPTHETKGLQWLTKCLSDVQEMRLVPMCRANILAPLTKHSSHTAVLEQFSMIYRAAKMIDRGWSIHTHIDGKSVLPLPVIFCPKGVPDTPCAKCLSGSGNSIRLKCGHVFHLDCLKLLLPTDLCPANQCHADIIF